MAKTLSILIPTLESRKDFLKRLTDCLKPQLTKDVEVLTQLDNGEETTGSKRNKLLQRARGEWSVFLDDDDLVSPDYLQRVRKALCLDPDTVGYFVERYVDGKPVDIAVHSMRFTKYSETKGVWSGKHYFIRTSNHINPVRTEISRSVGFKDVTVGEDCDYALRLKPRLKSEVFISDVLYKYLYRNK